MSHIPRPVPAQQRLPGYLLESAQTPKHAQTAHKPPLSSKRMTPSQRQAKTAMKKTSRNKLLQSKRNTTEDVVKRKPRQALQTTLKTEIPEEKKTSSITNKPLTAQDILIEKVQKHNKHASAPCVPPFSVS